MCKFFMAFIGAMFLCQFYSVELNAGSFSTSSNSAKKKWTILIYLNADNNLEGAGYEDVQEMARVGSTSQVNVVVQFDPVMPQGTKRLYIEQASIGASQNPRVLPSRTVEEMPEQDMGDPQVFTDFVRWGMNNYPAEHFMVIMWNHGSGWMKEGEASVRGISYDDTSGNYISTNELEAALDEIVSTTGNKIDVLAFDACLMSMVEVADALNGMVDYLVASEEVIPWDGYPYDYFLRDFALNSDLEPLSLVKTLVRTYGESYSGGSQGRKTVTLAAIDVSKLELVKRRLDYWLRSLRGSGLVAADFADAANQSQSYEYAENKDLGDFVKNVMNKLVTTKPDASIALVQDKAQAPNGAIGSSLSLIKSIQEAVIANFTSSAYMNSMGLAIYMPAPFYNPYYGHLGSSAWKYDTSKRNTYLDLRWARTTTWTKFLDELFLN